MHVSGHATLVLALGLVLYPRNGKKGQLMRSDVSTELAWSYRHYSLGSIAPPAGSSTVRQQFPQPLLPLVAEWAVQGRDDARGRMADATQDRDLGFLQLAMQCRDVALEVLCRPESDL